jgi:hypothetical protein
VADGEIIIGTAGTLANKHGAATVTKVLSLRMALTSITDDGNRLALEETEVCIVVVINFNRHLSNSCLTQIRWKYSPFATTSGGPQAAHVRQEKLNQT